MFLCAQVVFGTLKKAFLTQPEERERERERKKEIQRERERESRNVVIVFPLKNLNLLSTRINK
jgi:hypothetical protein